MEYQNINKDFIHRTLKIIQDYSGDYEVTLLLNCCTGLLVLPKEIYEQSIPVTEIPVNGSLWGLKRSYLSFGSQGQNFGLNDVIRRLRNGICHFNVQTVPDGSGEISTLIIKDSNPNGTSTFEAQLPIKAFKELVTNLAHHVV